MRGRAVTFNRTPALHHAPLPAGRRVLVLGALLLSMGALLGRAAYLQGVHDEFLQAQGSARYARTLQEPALRGRITDRNGEVLAVNAPVTSVWAFAEDARLSPAQLRELAQLLDLDVETLNRKLAGRGFVYLKRQVEPSRAAAVSALRLPGVHQQPDTRRFYPARELAAHVVGFTSIEDVGQEGMELALNEVLAGTPGERQVLKDRRGNVVEAVGQREAPRPGRDVHLALDGKVQYLTATALEEAVRTHKARAGAAVVLDAHTGEVLALANVPTYNPNNRAGLTGAQLRNRVLTDMYEPGSTMKPFIAAAALERGLVRPDTLVDTGRGWVSIGPARISDTKPHGIISVAEVIQLSSNVGTVQLAQKFSAAEMWALFDTLGFGRRLGLGFPGETGGRLRPAKRWRPVEQATMSFGHGISVNLMQMAHAYLALARDDGLIPLSLTRRDIPPGVGTRVFSPKTLAAVREMLQRAAGPEGTAPQAQTKSYTVAGKTGTAHKLENGRYVRKYVSSFVGFAPADKPRVVVAVMVDEPTAGGHYGGTVAGPVFSRITEQTLQWLGLPPDKASGQVVGAAARPAY